MKHCFYQLRKGIYERLNTLGYNVYQYPPKDVNPPYIMLADMSSAPGEEDADTYTQEVTIEIHVVVSYFGDQGSAIVVDEMTDDVIDALASKGITAADRAKAITMDDFIMTPGDHNSTSQQVNFDDVNREIRNVIQITALIDSL